MIRDIFITLRPKQWVKNVFVLAALIFAKRFLDPLFIFRSIFAFILFCGLSGSVYLLNDVLDRDNDRQHPEKKNRPLACGRLSVSYATAAFSILSVLSLVGSLFLGGVFFSFAAIFFILHVSYSFWLKQVVLIDIFAVAIGFVLRVLAGIAAVQSPYTPWILICTMFFALFISAGKRRAEMVHLEEGASDHRRILGEYTVEFLDTLIFITATSMIITYSLFAFTGKKNYLLVFTTPFVMYGIFRYLYLVYVKEQGGAPTEVFFSDKPLLINAILWGISSAVLMYFQQQ